MKIAYADWQRRISPLLDAASPVRIVEIVGGWIIEQRVVTLCQDDYAFSVACQLITFVGLDACASERSLQKRCVIVDAASLPRLLVSYEPCILCA